MENLKNALAVLDHIRRDFALLENELWKRVRDPTAADLIEIPVYDWIEKVRRDIEATGEDLAQTRLLLRRIVLAISDAEKIEKDFDEYSDEAETLRASYIPGYKPRAFFANSRK